MNTTAINTTLPVFDITAFVVPNAAMCYNSEAGNSPCSAKPDFYTMKYFCAACADVERFGIDVDNVTTSSMWVGVWLTGLGCENLTDHGMPKELCDLLPKTGLMERCQHLAPCSLPEEFLKDVKEGDTKSTFIKKWSSEDKDYVNVAEIRWHFNQLNYRYRNYGRFEDVVTSVINHGRAYAKKRAA